eukprot:gene7795-8606_t
MGCSGSKAESFKKLSHTAEFQVWMRKFQALRITPGEVRKLYKVFAKADMDGGGTIDLVELLTAIDVERTRFSERVFAIFDEDNSGKIDFGEFVLALWNYCTLSQVTLGMFAFDLYDRDSTGILEEKDLEMMLHDIYGRHAGTNHYARQVIVDLRELRGGGDVTLGRFLEFSRTHHSLLFPAFQLQLALKKSLLGVSFWEKHSERRVKTSSNKYIKIKDILAMHVKSSMEGSTSPVQSGEAQIAYESTGVKAERRRRSQNGTMGAEAQQAVAAVNGAYDQAYRDRLFNESSGGDNRSVATHNSSQPSLKPRKSNDGATTATNQLVALERDLHSPPDFSPGISPGPLSMAGLIQSKAAEGTGPAGRQRRKSVGTVTPVDPSVLEGTDTRGMHGRSMPLLPLRQKPGDATNPTQTMTTAATPSAATTITAAPPSDANAKPGKRKSTASSFIINSAGAGGNPQDDKAEQIKQIASHVAALHDAAEDPSDGTGGFRIVEAHVIDQRIANGHREFHVRPKPARRGSI